MDASPLGRLEGGQRGARGQDLRRVSGELPALLRLLEQVRRAAPEARHRRRRGGRRAERRGPRQGPRRLRARRRRGREQRRDVAQVRAVSPPTRCGCGATRSAVKISTGTRVPHGTRLIVWRCY